MIDVFPERYRNEREICANYGQFYTGKTRGDGSLSESRVNRYPHPSFLSSTARAHFFLRQESIRAIFPLFLQFHLQVNRSDFPLFRGRKERTLLPLPSLLSGYDRHGNCVGLQGIFFLFPQTNPLSPWENQRLVSLHEHLHYFSITGDMNRLGKSWPINS